MGDTLDALDSAKSQLRDEVRKLLVDALVKTNKSPAQSTSFSASAQSRQAIKEYLQQHGLEYTLSVFHAESESMRDKPTAFSQDSSKENRVSHSDLKLIAEQLWTRLERKYESKMRAWQDARDAETKRHIENLRLEYQSSLSAKAKELESDHAIKLAHLQTQEAEMRSNLNRKLAVKEAALESQRMEILNQLRDLEQKRNHLDQLQRELNAFTQSQKERNRLESSRLNERSTMVRKQELEMDERLERVAIDIQTKERARYGESLRKLTEREQQLVDASDRLSAQLNELQKYRKLADERAEKLLVLEAQVHQADIHYERLSQENQSLRHQLRKCSDYDHMKRDNDRLRIEIERLSADGREDAARRVAEAEMSGLRRQLALTERAAELKEQELKLRCENESAKFDELNKSFKAQTSELREMSKELAKLREQLNSGPAEKHRSAISASTYDTIARRANKAATMRLERGKSESAEDISSESTPDFVKDAKRRLKQFDRVSQQLDESIGAYRSNRQLTNAIQSALALPTIASYVPPPAVTRPHPPNFTTDAHMYTTAATTAAATASATASATAKNPDNVSTESDHASPPAIPAFSAIASTSSGRLPAAAIDDKNDSPKTTVDKQSSKKHVAASRQSKLGGDIGGAKSSTIEEEVESWEEKLKKREEERRKRDEELRLRELQELEQLELQQVENAKTNDASDSATAQAQQPSSAATNANVTEASPPKSVVPEPEIDPVMQKYMQMIMEQREKEKQSATEQTKKIASPREDRVAIADDIEVGDVGAVSDDDFEW